MLQKFKMTTYATLLLIGVFVLPYAGNVAEVSAENYNCSGSKKEVRQCLKAVISERDETIAEMQNKLDEADVRLEAAGLVSTAASKTRKEEEKKQLAIQRCEATAGSHWMGDIIYVKGTWCAER